MSGPDEIKQVAPLCAAASARQYSVIEQLLGYIVFEGHSLRIGLELTACVLGYLAMQSLVPWEVIGMDAQWASVYSWFVCCLVVVIIDLGLLCRNAHVFRRAYLLGLHKDFAKAAELIEGIGPNSNRWVRLPRSLYHLYRAELAARSGDSMRLGAELELAQEHGIARDRLLLQKLQILRAIGEVQSCNQLIEEIGEELGESSELLVEKVRTIVSQRGSWSEAKKLARRAKKLKDQAHCCGETSHRLASAYEAVAMLWSGEAEEGLEQLSIEIEQLRRSMLYVDTLRPIFSQLLLERSLYLATHKEPTPAVYDYTLSSALCSQMEFAELSSRIRQELEDRYSITLS